MNLSTTAAVWQRSTLCANSGCVEVSRVGDTIAIRDSKIADGPVLTYDSEEWTAFIGGIKAGEFDHLTGKG
jgi:hypothetical protein